MTNANYLRSQAEILLHLSRATIDLTVAGRLRALAAEFRAKAAELQEEAAQFAALAPHAERACASEGTELLPLRKN